MDPLRQALTNVTVQFIAALADVLNAFAGSLHWIVPTFLFSLGCGTLALIKRHDWKQNKIGQLIAAAVVEVMERGGNAQRAEDGGVLKPENKTAITQEATLKALAIPAVAKSNLPREVVQMKVIEKMKDLHAEEVKTDAQSPDTVGP